jgi:hypothetical protein
VLFDQNPDETLQAAHDGAVQHHRAVAAAVSVTYSASRRSGIVEIDLHRAALPLAADARPSACIRSWGRRTRRRRASDFELAPDARSAFHQRVFGLVPAFVGADAASGRVATL